MASIITPNCFDFQETRNWAVDATAVVGERAAGAAGAVNAPGSGPVFVVSQSKEKRRRRQSTSAAWQRSDHFCYLEIIRVEEE